MTEKKKTDNLGKEESTGKEFNCCNGSMDDMSKMMQKFFSEKDSFDCRAMMQQMCSDKSKETKK